MVSKEMKAGLDNIDIWTEYEKEADKNTVESGSSDGIPFLVCMIDKNTDLLHGYSDFLRNQIRAKGGKRSFKREFVNKHLSNFTDKDGKNPPQIRKGYRAKKPDEYVDKVDKDGNVMLNSKGKPLREMNQDARDKNRQFYDDVGHLRATLRQFNINVGCNSQSDYIRFEDMED